MGKRGPKPRPTPLKILYGESKDRINQNPPQPPVTANPARTPTSLSTQAKGVWKRLAPSLAERGLLTEWDREAFGVWCEAVVAHRAATAMIEAEGLIIDGCQGTRVKNPAFQIVRESASVIRMYGAEFGLSPSSRSSLMMKDTADDSDLQALLS